MLGPGPLLGRPRRWPVLLGTAALAGLVLLGIVLLRGNSPPPAHEVRPVRVAWTFEQVERGAIISSPLVADDCVYVGAIRDAGLATSGAVYCLDRHTGKRVWDFDDDGAMQHMYSSPCLADGRLYIGEGMHANHVCKLYCLDAATGRKLWHFETAGHIESSPCVAGGRVFFGSGDDGIFCLDAVSGRERWHFHGPFHIDTSAAVVDGLLYGGSGVSRKYKDTEIFCLDTGDGGVRWRQRTDLPVWASPTVAGDQVFFGLGNGRLNQDAEPPAKPAGAVLCVDARTGATRWRCDVPNGVLAQPTVDGERVYFGSRDGCCYAIDRRGGHPCWKQSLGSPVVTRPALAGGRLFVAARGGRVARLDAATGQVHWVFDVAGYSQTKPVLYSSPAAVPEAGGPALSLYFGAELRLPSSSAAVLYCLRDQGP